MYLPKREYRREYQGEWIIVGNVYNNRQWNPTKNFKPDNVHISTFSSAAVVIGNGYSREQFDLNIFNTRMPPQNKKLLTYGCNAIYRDFVPDFLVIKIAALLDEADDVVPRSNKTIMYVDSINLTVNNRFNIIPLNPYTNAGNTATYLACFDGALTVYMMGFDGQDSPGLNSTLYAQTLGYSPFVADEDGTRWKADFIQIATVYSNVKFIFLYPKVRPVIEEYSQLPNVSVMSFYDFVVAVDL